MNYYIFQVSDRDNQGKKITAQEIFNFLVRDKKQWGFGPRTPNRKKIEKGDRILFYVTGVENQYFVGTAELNSGVYKGDLTDINEVYSDPEAGRIDLTNVTVFSEPRFRKSFPDLEWYPNQGGSTKISESDYNLVVGLAGTNILERKNVNRDETEFVLEKYLEEFILSNWKKINFGEKLHVFEDEDGNKGEQYFTEGVGYIDILAIDESHNFVVIELKKGRKNDEVIGQILRYMGWVRSNLAKNGQGVRGLVIVGEKDKKLEYALQEISNKVKVLLYKIDFSLVNYY